MSLGMLVAVIINIILSFGISATSALFLYLICERALKPALQKASRDGFAAKKSASQNGKPCDLRYCQGGGFTPEDPCCP
jgi:hypothetical protein